MGQKLYSMTDAAINYFYPAMLGWLSRPKTM